METGTKVTYSRAFLRSAGIYTHEQGASRVGYISGSHENERFIFVHWEDRTEPELILKVNIIPVADIHKEPV